MPDDAFKPESVPDGKTAAPGDETLEEEPDADAAAAHPKVAAKAAAAARKAEAKTAKAEAKAAKQTVKFAAKLAAKESKENGAAAAEDGTSSPPKPIAQASMNAFEVEDGGSGGGGKPAAPYKDDLPPGSDRAPTSLRAVIFTTLDDPESSTVAAIIGASIMLMIFLGSFVFVVETMPDVKKKWGDEMDVLETVCVVSFTMDYCMRVLTCTARPVRTHAPPTTT